MKVVRLRTIAYLNESDTLLEGRCLLKYEKIKKTKEYMKEYLFQIKENI